MQDWGTASGPSNSLSRRRHRARATGTRWAAARPGSSPVDPADPNIVYAGEYVGYISRYDHGTRAGAQHQRVYPTTPPARRRGPALPLPVDGADRGLAARPERPLPRRQRALPHARPTAATWTAISPDLTRNDKSKQQWSGGPITGDNTGVEVYARSSRSPSRRTQKGLIWAGSDDGLVHVTRDGGKTWTNVTAAMPGLPEWGTVEPHRALAVRRGDRLRRRRRPPDRRRPAVPYKTTDFGKTWRRLDAALPQDVYLHAVREDPKRKGLLYVGTERGVWFSPDDGATWQPLRLNLPTVAVHDLVVKDDDLVLATHGRSIWILDDLVAVRALTPQIAAGDLHVFPIPERSSGATSNREASRGRTESTGRGAIHYYLKTKPKGDVTLEILDAQGTSVRTLTLQTRGLDGSYEWEVEEAESDPRSRTSRWSRRGARDRGLPLGRGPEDPRRNSTRRFEGRAARAPGRVHTVGHRRRTLADDDARRETGPAGHGASGGLGRAG